MTLKSIKFEEKITVLENQDVVFDYTQDYKNRLEWDTFLQRADLLDGATKAGMGVKAYCQAQNGVGIITEYVSFIRPRVTAIKMTSKSPIFKSFMGSWNFHSLDDKKTEVIFLYSFCLKFPFNMFSKAIKKKLISNVKQRLLDLKKCIED